MTKTVTIKWPKKTLIIRPPAKTKKPKKKAYV